MYTGLNELSISISPSVAKKHKWNSIFDGSSLPNFLCSNFSAKQLWKNQLNDFQYIVSVSSFELALSWLLESQEKLVQWMNRKIENKSKSPYQLRWPYIIEYEKQDVWKSEYCIC